MASHNAVALVELRDSAYVLADPEQDMRGRVAVDRGGDELGQVRDLPSSTPTMARSGF